MWLMMHPKSHSQILGQAEDLRECREMEGWGMKDPRSLRRKMELLRNWFKRKGEEGHRNRKAVILGICLHIF